MLCTVMNRARKERLDLLLVERGLANSQAQAQRLIMSGQVTVGDQVVDKPGTKVLVAAPVTVKARQPYVSRAGLKLAAAIDAFQLKVDGWIVADVGASTGGFTDCLLQHGASRVYAIDVGYGQLAWKLRQDPRVVVMDRTNARYVERLPQPIDLVTIDVSFISLKLILQTAIGWLKPGGQVVALIKPQFEARQDQVEDGGVVRDTAVHRAVLETITNWGQSHGLGLMGMVRSPITGPAGNVEFLAWWAAGRPGAVEAGPLIEACLQV
jgi:23S rRNA (cytidine1920-2'-O)/16S rRNA (cytidine1409-2'-O)-methyltransferase